MVSIAGYEDGFNEIYSREKRKIVAYGAGYQLRKNFNSLPDIDLICDRDAQRIVELNGIDVVEPDILQTLNEPLYIIVCILDNMVYLEVCNSLKELHIDAIVFNYFNNISFCPRYLFLNTPIEYQEVNSSRPMSVNIVLQEREWIFKKFEDRMVENLSKYGVDVSISSDSRSDVDVNHHIAHCSYTTYTNDTIMITHINNFKELMILKKQLEVAGMGICMSSDTMNKLVSYGVPRNKLCYINPAQDSVIKPHKYLIGITNRCYDGVDVRKRATSILDALEGVNPIYFRFSIMGAGWDKIIQEMKERGFEVEYHPEFIYDQYNSLMQKIDYFLYMGFDEGAMGYLDALAAGAGTIVTPQGFHLDADCPIDYPCSTVGQFREAFLDLQRKREKHVQAVSNWTWDQYSQKHLEIWNYLLRRKSLKELYKNQLCYEDGIFSAMIVDSRV